MRKIILFFLFLLALFPVPARAQETVLPEEIRGVLRVTPDCKKPSIGFFFGRRYAVEIAASAHIVVRMNDIRPAASGPGAWEMIRSDEGYRTALRALDGGVLLYSIPLLVNLGSPMQPARAEEDNVFALRFHECPVLPDSMEMDEDVKYSFAAFERADEVCDGQTPAGNPSCRRAAFDVADADMSGALDAGELAAFWNHIAWLAEGRTCGTEAPLPPAHGGADAVRFAARALGVADADKSGGIGFSEAEIFWPAFMASAEGALLRAMLASVTVPAPWLKVPAP